MHHEKPQLHPRQRTSTGSIANVSDAEHEAAYLQHDVHAEEITDFFVMSFPGASSIPPEGVKVQVFTRWDSPTLPAEANSVTVGREVWADAAELGEPSLVLEMFNNSGTGFTGYHYDPIFEANMESGEEHAEDADSTAPPPPPPAHDAERPRKRLRRKTPAKEAEAAGHRPMQPPGFSSFKQVPSREESKVTTIEFFKASCMDADRSPDPRCRLEQEIMKISQELRDDATPQRTLKIRMLLGLRLYLEMPQCSFQVSIVRFVSVHGKVVISPS